jgi:hypothetical protein
MQLCAEKRFKEIKRMKEEKNKQHTVYEMKNSKNVRLHPFGGSTAVEIYNNLPSV